MADLEFRRDLYRGIAHDYDRFRVPYPRSLIDDLAGRSGAAGRGRLLDLACGTGQVTFALAGRFGEVWAVDQEPDGLVSRRRSFPVPHSAATPRISQRICGASFAPVSRQAHCWRQSD